MGSPTVTFVGPAVAVIVKLPMAPVKFAGLFCSGSGSDSTLTGSRRQRDLFLFALIEKLPEERIAALILRRQHDDGLAVNGPSVSGAGSDDGERNGERNDGVNAVADLHAAALVLQFGDFAGAETIRRRAGQLEIAEILHVVAQIKFKLPDLRFADVNFVFRESEFQERDFAAGIHGGGGRRVHLRSRSI